MIDRPDMTKVIHTSEDDNFSSPDFLFSPELLPLDLRWGATPLMTSLDLYPEVVRRQQEVFDALLERAEMHAPDDVPESLREYVKMSIMHRFTNRAIRNSDSYLDCLQPNGYTPYLESALRASATPSQLLDVRRAKQMRSIELARITDPYGVFINELAPMHAAVEAGIIENGGILIDPADQEVKYKLRQSDIIADPSRDVISDGFLVTSKRTIGLVDDDTHIIERTSFIIRTDAASDLDPKIIDALRRVKVTKNDNWAEEISAIINLDELVPALIAEDNSSSLIHLSKTYYAFNKTTDEQIKERNLEQKSARRAKDASFKKKLAAQAIESGQRSR